MSLFDDVETIDTLKKRKKENEDFPLYLKKKILSCEDDENLMQEINEWLNSLIKEYNEKTERENFLRSEMQEEDELLFNVIKVCTQFVSLQSQPYFLTNLCILANDDKNVKFHAEYFSATLEEANEIVFKMLELEEQSDNIYVNDEILSVLGFLNFRAHKYEKAKLLLRCSTELISSSIESDSADYEQEIRFISSKIHLASCFEYEAYDKEIAIVVDPEIEKNNFTQRKRTLSNALEQLLGCNDEIFKDKIDHNKDEINKQVFKYYKDSLANVTLRKVVKIIEKFAETSCLTLKIFSMEDTRKIREVQNEYIHVLAHCLSEYAVLVREDKNDYFQKYPFCSELQLISRFLLDWLVAKKNSKYITCQATVRAENDATPEAIDLLLKQIESNKNDNEENSDNVAELKFFIFYFAEQEARLEYNNEKFINIFRKYKAKFYEYADRQTESGKKDYDALFHYYIVYFRYLLKQSANFLVDNRAKNNKETEDEVNKVYNKLSDLGKRISGHILKPVKNEFLRLKKLYLYYQQIKNLNYSNPELTLNERNEFELLVKFHKEVIQQDIDYSEIMSEIYREIIAPKNIPLLAPVHNAPSCSFSMGNIDRLLVIPQLIISEDTIDCKSFIEKQASAVDLRSVEKTMRLKIRDSMKDKFKWAIYIAQNQVFLYYSDFIDSHDKAYKMFPVILDDDERKYCNQIVTELFDKVGNGIAPCKEPMNTCQRSCYTHFFKINDDKIRKKLLELLIFLEFDFCIYDKDKKAYFSRIQADDIIIAYRKKLDNEYRISGYTNFNADKEKTKGCKICEFLPVDIDSNTASEQEEVSNKKEKEKCQMVNFKKVASKLSDMKRSYSEDSLLGRWIEEVCQMNSECENAVQCPHPENREKDNCNLLRKFHERCQDDVYGEVFR